MQLVTRVQHSLDESAVRVGEAVSQAIARSPTLRRHLPDTWSPATYLQFEDERTRPARDLLAQVPLVAARKVVDVGCGPGNSTALLVARYPDAKIVGIDSSPAMLEEARRSLADGLFIEGDANTWLPDPDTDLVFANATYHWVPDHLMIFRRILSTLRPGAVLAVQMPDNLAEPAHQLMRQVAAHGPWTGRLAGADRAPLPPVGEYYDALQSEASRLDIWHTIYNHVLDGPEAIVDWVRGTGLRPFIDPLPPDERAEFLSRYQARIADAYPPATDGKVLLRFPRFFIIAAR
jgi:trans-aconitate 2-methyltransferase